MGEPDGQELCQIHTEGHVTMDRHFFSLNHTFLIQKMGIITANIFGCLQ